MTAEEHLAEAEKLLQTAHGAGGNHARVTALAALSTAHATIAQAKRKETKR
ncbi:hypothetical protein KDL01_04250 [Actinospica durhamensis]|uniref:Uncharacterized protein n=1 Tax=Actinospica durhamensis TaxID=1508375 RepID=A0A941IM47_9ACTN|nr:hypothetical protein [Actinospica durhamensis]MBR7832454.1 hypothetical protein [Actinospica durhamensis]